MLRSHLSTTCMEHTTLHGLVEDISVIHQGRSAVIFDDGGNQVHLSYGEMSRIATKIHKVLSELPVEHEVVGVCLQMGCHVPAVLLGILQSDCSFYNFAADSVEFVSAVIQEIHVRLLLVDIHCLQKLENIINKLQGEVTLCFLPDCPCYVLIHLRAIPTQRNDHNLAYCITTSGTTGRPKVVRVPHRCIVPNILHIRELFALRPDDLVFLSSPLTFDPSIVEMFTTFSVGACLLMVPSELKVMPDRLLDVLYTRNKVSIMQATPTLLFSLNPDSLPITLLGDTTVLRVLSLGGEKFPPCAKLRQLLSQNNQTQLYNLYGTTEVSCWASYYKVSAKDLGTDSEIPVGEPLLHTTVQVLDGQGCPLMDGVGEIHIGGTDRQCIIGNDESANYTINTMKLRATGDMARVTKDGIFYIGRTDSQVKRHGKRINLNEIKQVVETFTNVRECSAHLIDNNLVLFLTKCHTTEDDVNKDDAIENHSGVEHMDFNLGVSYISNTNDIYSDGTNDREFLKAVNKIIRLQLPPHYMPDTCLMIQRFPMTKHGKIDKEHLKKIYESSKTKSWPAVRMPIVEFVTGSWKDMLGIDTSPSVPENSMFILSGGNSFKAVQLHNQIEAHLNASLPNLLDVILHKPFSDLITILIEQTEINSNILKASMPANIIISVDGNGEESSEIVIAKNQIHTDDGVSKSISNSEIKHGKSAADIAENAETNIYKTNQEIKMKQIVNEHESSINCINAFVTHGKKVVLKRKLESVDVCRIAALRTNVKDSSDLAFVSRGNPQAIQSDSVNIYEVLRVERPNNSVINKSHSDSAKQNYHLELVWRYDTGKCVDASPVIAVSGSTARSIYIGSHSHRFCSLSLTTGECRWETTLADRIESSACLSNCGKYVIVGCYDGNVNVFLSGSGDTWWSCQTGAEVKCSPVVDMATGLVYVGSHSRHVYALNLQDKTVVWERDLQAGSIFASPAISYNPHRVYVATLGGKLFSLNHATGVCAWSYNCGKPLFSSPCVMSYGLCIGCTDSALYCLGFNGQLMWKFDTGGPIFSSPAILRNPDPAMTCNVDKPESTCERLQTQQDKDEQTIGSCVGNLDECIVFGSHDNCVYCVTSSGHLTWKVEVDSHIYSTPFPVCSNSSYNDGKIDVRKQTCETAPLRFDSKLTECVNSDNINRNRRLPLDDAAEDLSLRTVGTAEVMDSYADHATLLPHRLVVCASTRGTVYVVDGVSGDNLCSYTLPGEVFSSPVVYQHYIVIGCRDNFVYCLKIVKNTK